MKKLLLLLVGCILSFATSAQLYVIGADASLGMESNGNWNLGKALYVSSVSTDGYYHFKAPKGKQFQMGKQNDGNWDNSSQCFNGGTLYRNSDWSESNGVKTITTTLTWNGDNGNRNFTINDDYLFVRVSSDYTKVQLCKDEYFGEYTYSYQLVSGQQKLLDFTGENPYEVTFNIETPLTQDTPLCVRRVRNDNVTVDYSVQSALLYDGTNGKDYALVEGNNDNLTLKEALEGAVKFVLTVAENVPTSINISGGEIKAVDPEPSDNQHTIYFYEKIAINTLTTHIWVAAGNSYTTWGQLPSLEKTGKYVIVNEKYYPVWKFSFEWDQDPKGILFMINGTKTKDLVYVENGLYTNDTAEGVTVEAVTPDRLVDKEIPDAVYMHFKYDLEVNGKDGANTIPVCQFYNTTTQATSQAVNMTLESARYSIWKAPLTAEDMDKYDAVRFSFQGKDRNPMYDSAKDNGKNAVTFYDKANWTKYIYSSATQNNNNEFAAQTYLSYAQFKALDQADIDNGGRRNIYIVGGGFQYFDESGNSQNIPGELTSSLKLSQDEGCFYLPVQPNNNSWFKVSWLSVKDAIPAGYSDTYKDRKREWATFDLGLIGIDKDYKYPEGYTVNYNRESGNGKVYFDLNRSVRCMNYNQADWVLPINSNKCWVIFDTHVAYNADGTIDEANSCKSATITTFDPDPSVKATVSDVMAREDDLTEEQAEAMNLDPMFAEADNGKIYMKRVNKAVGKAQITATTLDDINNAEFNREYTIYVNNHQVGKPVSTDLNDLTIDYMPLSYNGEENSLAVRAKFVAKTTGLSFHSRTGKGQIDAPNVDFKAPNKPELTGRYIYEDKDEDGNEVYGVYVTGLDCELASNPDNYNYYSDFSFNCGTAVRFIDKKHSVHESASDLVLAWDGWTPGQDWSTKLCDERTLAPVFIHGVAHVANISQLQEMTITCKVYAVYPFMYNPEATFSIGQPSEVAARVAGESDLTGFKVMNSSVPVETTFTVSPDNAVSGVEAVEAEADNNAETIWYTISGVRVAGDPAPGLYIRVRGEKVEKVVVR